MRPSRLIFWVIVVGIICATPAVHADSGLQDAVTSAAASHSGTIGVVVQDLATGETASLNADHRFTSASLYKLFVLETAEAAIDDGSLDPSEMLTLSGATAAADPYSDLQVGTRISVDCALQTMVEMSGNSAADLLLSRLGLSTVNQRISSDGLSRTSIGAETAYTSPADTASLLASIAQGTDVSAAASQRTVDLLSAQQHNDRIPAPLPLGVRVAHKTGELPDLRHDAAIVFAPSGTYILVVMVEDAQSEAEARSAIVDVSRSVYETLEHTPTAAAGSLPPRIAEEVYRIPDAQNRMALLGDPRTETTLLPDSIQVAADAAPALRVRPEVLPDLAALQQAASAAGAPFWVRSAFRQPSDAEAPYAIPTEWYLPCPVEQPARVADRPVSPTEIAAAAPHQAWLGTVVEVSDSAVGPPSTSDDAASPTWQWLSQNGSNFGFVPALPEPPAAAGNHQPWTLRWVGRDMASRVMRVDSADYPARLTATLGQAESFLAPTTPPASVVSDACWTIPTTSTRGCPSRWYFLGLPLS